MKFSPKTETKEPLITVKAISVYPYGRNYEDFISTSVKNIL